MNRVPQGSCDLCARGAIRRLVCQEGQAPIVVLGLCQRHAAAYGYGDPGVVGLVLRAYRRAHRLALHGRRVLPRAGSFISEP